MDPPSKNISSSPPAEEEAATIEVERGLGFDNLERGGEERRNLGLVKGGILKVEFEGIWEW